MAQNPGLDQELNFGKIFHLLMKNYSGVVAEFNKDLDIDRYFYTLLVIDDHPQNLTQTKLAEILAIDKVSMFRILDYLSASKYIIRKSCNTDRRAHTIALTDKGKSQLSQIRAGYQLANETCLDGFSPEQKKALPALLCKMLDNLQSKPQRPTALFFYTNKNENE